MRFLFSQSSSSPSFANPCRKIERTALSLFLCLLLLCIVALGQQDLITDIRVHGNRRIPVVFAQQGSSRLVVRRETWDELSVRDVG